MKKKMDKNWQDFCNWVSYLSLLGTVGSCCNFAFQVAAAKHWSFYLLIYSLIPFCWFGLIYICCYCLVKKTFGYSIPYCNGNTRKFIFGLIVIFIVINVILCNVKDPLVRWIFWDSFGKESLMKKEKLKIIVIVVCICIFSTPIATVISNCMDITTDEYMISRIDNYSSSIRVACIIWSMYLCGRKEK